MKRIFVTAGHDPVLDPGACANGVREADLTVELRDLVVRELLAIGSGAVIYTEPPRTTLTQVWTWLFGKVTNNDIAIDIHFNAASFEAFGCEVFYRVPPVANELDFAERLMNAVADAALLKKRGIKPESQSQHKKLWIFNHAFIRPMAALIEVCFITNLQDLKVYQANKVAVAKAIAKVLVAQAKA